jgi:hypothetical protein
MPCKFLLGLRGRVLGSASVWRAPFFFDPVGRSSVFGLPKALEISGEQAYGDSYKTYNSFCWLYCKYCHISARFVELSNLVRQTFYYLNVSVIYFLYQPPFRKDVICPPK